MFDAFDVVYAQNYSSMISPSLQYITTYVLNFFIYYTHFLMYMYIRMLQILNLKEALKTMY